ncbi:MAG: hypothetical protein CVT60_03865 [Actinobacteria bacterium HGW-Actinobacteria-10]|nr:MAG: hypothetical protein CVT60_03865 [Actinobacteria bacterium HGW-Actinobacteria-10]
MRTPPRATTRPGAPGTARSSKGRIAARTPWTRYPRCPPLPAPERRVRPARPLPCPGRHHPRRPERNRRHPRPSDSPNRRRKAPRWRP